MLLLISYDLRSPGRNYTELYDAIKKAGNWWHHLESVWIIKTDASPKEWHEYLIQYMDQNDHLFVIEVKNNYYGILPKEAWPWLENNFRQ